jgi:crotonobetainyl-CoA:carnitine CoA-transferase CaiB-like acyl-CoA transferase
MFPLIDHPTAGAHHVTGTPVKLSATPGQPRVPAPLVGQHTRCALKALLSLGDPELDALARDGVIFDPRTP